MLSRRSIEDLGDSEVFESYFMNEFWSNKWLWIILMCNGNLLFVVNVLVLEFDFGGGFIYMGLKDIWKFLCFLFYFIEDWKLFLSIRFLCFK